MKLKNYFFGVRILVWVLTILFFLGGLCAEPQNSSDEAYYHWEDSISFFIRWFIIFLCSGIFIEVVYYIGKKANSKNKPQKF